MVGNFVGKVKVFRPLKPQQTLSMSWFMGAEIFQIIPATTTPNIGG